MRKLLVIALALTALALTGAKTEQAHPACLDTGNGPEIYRSFVQAGLKGDQFAVEFYMQMGCAFMKGDMEAEVLERGDYWVKIRVSPEGYPPAVLYTSPASIKE